MIEGKEGDSFWDSSRSLFWYYTGGRWVKSVKGEDTDKIRQLANDIDFYRTTADESPEMVRAAGVELAVIAANLISTAD